jgi:hypothetical protein
LLQIFWKKIVESLRFLIDQYIPVSETEEPDGFQTVEGFLLRNENKGISEGLSGPVIQKGESGRRGLGNRI